MAKKPPRHFAQVARGYDNLWRKAKLVKREAATARAKKILEVLPRYSGITNATGVPEWVIGVLHSRESDLNFGTYLGNGQPLNRRTTIVPKGRGPFKDFTDGAIDAIRLEGLYAIDDWSAARVLYITEKYNGWGYFMRGINSSYVWGGTDLQQNGKFVRDGVFDRNAWDPQLGTAAIMKALAEQSPEISAQLNKPLSPMVAELSAPEASPVMSLIQQQEKATMAEKTPEEAIVDVKPLWQKKTFWAALIAAAVPLLALATKGRLNLDPQTQEYAAIALTTAAGLAAAYFGGTSSSVTPMGKAKAEETKNATA